MRLDLKEILQKDGTIPFSCTTDLSDLHFPAISRFLSPVSASGRVTAGAGVLTLTGTVSAEAICLCDRCGKNLNDGPCGCTAETDPRLAVLGQLLEQE